MFFDGIAPVDYKFGKRDVRKMENLVISNNSVDDIYDYKYFDSMVIEEQTPEELSFELYKTVDYYWTLLYVNKIVNPYEDWVIPIESLYDYCVNKYGEENIIKPKYFLDTTNDKILVGIAHDNAYQYWLDNEGQAPLNTNLITNYEYEQRLNDQKRYIRYVPEGKILSFIDNYENAIRNNIK